MPIHLENWLLADVDYDVSLVQFILRADQCCNPYGSLFDRLEFPGLAGLDANADQCCANPLSVGVGSLVHYRIGGLPLNWRMRKWMDQIHNCPPNVQDWLDWMPMLANAVPVHFQLRCIGRRLFH